MFKKGRRFRLAGWEGRFLGSREWVEASDSPNKAPAEIAPRNKIVLGHFGKHGLVEMTYERRVAEMGKTSLS